MVCWGILGFLAGLIFNKVDIDKVKSRSFQIVAGPVVCIAAALVVAYVAFLIFRREGETFFGWRLYVFGAAGLLAGLLIQRKRLPIDDITLCIFGFLGTFIIYGGIMNIATMVMASAIPASGVGLEWESLKILYISGVPYDASHGMGTAFFLFLFGEKVIRKIERAKIKYGMYR
jgi:energy-coupling factor transport system substrate-specific component